MRLATFNCENLFARYKFKKNAEITKDGFTIDETAFDMFNPDEKKITGQAIIETDADVIALQEVENLNVVDKFIYTYLKDQGYENNILIDSHDPRFIDVAVLSKYPIVPVRTHRNEKNQAGKYLFSRDCLEAEIEVDDKNLVLYVNHFKSMMEGRDKTRPRREAQAQRVVEIIDSRWKAQDYQGNFAVLGDLNDYPDEGTALNPLLNHTGLENVVERLPIDDQWTHFYNGKKEYHQLDYILLSKSLAKKNQGTPQIMRKGLPKRAERYTGPRFDNVGDNKPKASDHAPVYMDIELD